MYIILSTTSGSRSSITAGFSGYTIDEFINKINKNEIYGTLRYINLTNGYGRESKLSTMDKKEFESVFVDNGSCRLTMKQVDKFFNKVLQKEYGTLSKFKNVQRIGKRDLVVGNIYKDESDIDILYCGTIKAKTNTPYSSDDVEGYMFVPINDFQNFNLDGGYGNSIINGGSITYNIIKKTNSKRLMIDTGMKINLPRTLSGASNDGKRNVSITFLEV